MCLVMTGFNAPEVCRRVALAPSRGNVVSKHLAGFFKQRVRQLAHSAALDPPQGLKEHGRSDLRQR